MEATIQGLGFTGVQAMENKMQLLLGVLHMELEIETTTQRGMDNGFKVEDSKKRETTIQVNPKPGFR